MRVSRDMRVTLGSYKRKKRSILVAVNNNQTSARSRYQETVGTESTGPTGFLESRTSTPSLVDRSGWLGHATSTQSEPDVPL